MVKQTERKFACPRRLDKFLLDVQLHERDSLNQVPWDHYRKKSSRFRVFFSHYKPHLLRVAASSGPAHPLKEAGHCKRRVDLECPLKSSDIYSKFKSRSGADGHR